MKENFQSRLKELRGTNSQANFAKLIGVTQVALSSWERGARDPAASTISLIARSCGVSSDWLLGLSDDPHPATRAGSAVANGNGVAVSGGVNGNGSIVAGNGNVVSPAGNCEALAKRVAELEKIVKKLTKAKK